MLQFLGLLGRKVAVVNLDPANDRLPYECAVDVRGLVSLEDVQDSEGLGPNGGGWPFSPVHCPRPSPFHGFSRLCIYIRALRAPEPVALIPPPPPFLPLGCLPGVRPM